MRHRYWLLLFVSLLLLSFVACSRQTAATPYDLEPHPLFSSDNSESIYAADPNDSWNRIFRSLFTRNVKARLSSDFPEGAPFVHFSNGRMGWSPLRISKGKFDRKEIGDRPIEPLYPTFLTANGPLQVLTEPRFSELMAALTEAIAETKPRSPLERALMQSDVWAAYDIIYAMGRRTSRNDPSLAERKAKLLRLLGEFVRKLALSSEQINSIKSNYRLAVERRTLTDVLSSESGWLEIEFLLRRAHDESAGFRRAARVFVKPRLAPTDPEAFVEKLKHNQRLDEVEAVALVLQNLLIDSLGRVVASPLFSEVQFRVFTNDAKTGTIHTEVKQFELSRRLLLTNPVTGGFIIINQNEPAYLSLAGNDYGFATSIDDAGAPVVVPLRTRCAQCHGEPLTALLTYSIHYFPPVPTVKILNPAKQERSLYVARIKEQREDFKSLFGVR